MGWTEVCLVLIKENKPAWELINAENKVLLSMSRVVKTWKTEMRTRLMQWWTVEITIVRLTPIYDTRTMFCLPLPVSIPRRRHHTYTHSERLSLAYYSFIDPKKMNGWVGHVGWHTASWRSQGTTELRHQPDRQVRISHMPYIQYLLC